MSDGSVGRVHNKFLIDQGEIGISMGGSFAGRTDEYS